MALLSACQHTPNQTDETVYKESTSVGGSSTTNTTRHPNTTSTERYPNSTSRPSRTTNRPATTYPTQNTPNRSTDQSVYSSNLFDRIRSGFRFPHLESKYISEYEKWNATHPRYLKDLFNRADPILYYIVEEIEKRGLPMEIALLPAIESAYKPNAISRSKAGGLWQFIPSTGKSYGLTQDWWYDGRRDLILSTNAALDYLTILNKRFNGDWFITLAAYNAGQGNIGRAIKRNQSKGKGTDYSSLPLRSETRRYVPKIIALKNIINNPHAYNVRLPVISNSPKFEILALKGQIDLNKFSKETGIDSKTLNHLNAGFLRWATSPNGPHRLLLPLNNPSALQKARVASQKVIKLDYQRHQIASGDTLSTIARRYGVSISELKSANKLSNSRIRAGKTLLIPFNGQTPVASVANNKPAAPSATRSFSSTSIPTPTGTNRHGITIATPVSSSSFNQSQTNPKVIHKVKRGDTLWGIARRYKVKVDQLLNWNKLSRNHTLSLNQSLVVFP